MPYNKELYGSKKQWGKYKSCIAEVKKKLKEKKLKSVNPYAVCRASIYD